MNTVEVGLLKLANERLRPLAQQLIDEGFRPELIVFAPSEIERIPGYKVALVVPLSPRDEDSHERSEPVVVTVPWCVALRRRVAWSSSLHPGSWGIWLDRKAERPYWLWRLNVGPLHVIGVPKSTNSQASPS